MELKPGNLQDECGRGQRSKGIEGLTSKGLREWALESCLHKEEMRPIRRPLGEMEGLKGLEVLMWWWKKQMEQVVRATAILAFKGGVASQSQYQDCDSGYGHLKQRGLTVTALGLYRYKTSGLIMCQLGCPKRHLKLPKRLVGLEVRMEMLSHFAGDECVTLRGWVTCPRSHSQQMTGSQAPGLSPDPSLVSWPSDLCWDDSLVPALSRSQFLYSGVRTMSKDKTSFHSEHLLWTTICFTSFILLFPSTELTKASSKDNGLLNIWPRWRCR